MKKYIAIFEIEDDCKIVGDINASVTYTYRENGTLYGRLESVEFKSLEQEPKTGEWIEHFDESGKWYECDQCHSDWGGVVNFCPNCGAKMEGESHEHIHA